MAAWQCSQSVQAKIFALTCNPPHFMVPRLKLRALHILRKRSTTEPHPQFPETSSIAFLLVLSMSDVRRLG